MDRRSTAHMAESVRADVEAQGVPCVLYNGNAAAERHREAALDALEAVDPAPQVGILVHSLAFGTLRPATGTKAERLSTRHLDMTLEVMAHSLLYWTQALMDRGWLMDGARIFALTSSGSLFAIPQYGAVSAAKAALEAHVRQLAVELAPRGIRANAIMAGLCRTPSFDKIPGSDDHAERLLARHPSGRLTRPEDVAACIVALSGPGAAWMTGNVIRVDGGETVAA